MRRLHRCDRQQVRDELRCRGGRARPLVGARRSGRRPARAAGRCERLRPGRVGHAVVVGEAHDSSARCAHSDVARDRRSLAHPSDQTRRAPSGDHCMLGGGIGGAIVDDDDLETGGRLPRERR